MFKFILAFTFILVVAEATVVIKDVPELVFKRDEGTVYNPKQPQIVCRGDCQLVPKTIICKNTGVGDNGYATWGCSGKNFWDAYFEFRKIDCVFATETTVLEGSCWIEIEQQSTGIVIMVILLTICIVYALACILIRRRDSDTDDTEPNELTKLVYKLNTILYIMRTVSAYFKVLYDKLVGVYYYGTGHRVNRVYGSNPSSMHLSNILRPLDQVDDNLYLGNAFDAADLRGLKELSISTVVNATKEIRNYFEDQEDMDYLKIDILDNGQATIEPFFQDFLDFINEHPDEKILIHCYMGSSRSATLVLLYLVIKHEMSVDEALQFLKQKRDVVNINTVFLDELRTFVNKNELLPVVKYHEKKN